MPSSERAMRKVYDALVVLVSGLRFTEAMNVCRPLFASVQRPPNCALLLGESAIA